MSDVNLDEFYAFLDTYYNNSLEVQGARRWKESYPRVKSFAGLKKSLFHGPVHSKESFLHAASILLSRPTSYNKEVYSTLNLNNGDSSTSIILCNGSPFQMTESKMIETLRSHMDGPFTKDSFKFFEDQRISKVVCVRTLLLKEGSPIQYYEKWDFKRPGVEFCSVMRIMADTSHRLSWGSKRSTNCFHDIQLEASETSLCAKLVLFTEPDEPEDEFWLNRFDSNIFPKFVKWAQEDTNSFIRAPSFYPSGSLRSVNNQVYLKTYKELKRKLKDELQQIWTESNETTNADKFISEDIGIASFIEVLSTNRRMVLERKFVDLGCGNGLLVFLLCQLGWTGVGIDIRRRKIWDYLPGMAGKLLVANIRDPDFPIAKFADCYTLVIGNHPDEITPWIMFHARKVVAPFIVIPCCPYDFNGKYERKSFPDLEPTSSTYQNYNRYLYTVGVMLNYECMLERLRIPSTKRIAIIGKYNPNQTQTAKLASEIFSKKLAIEFSRLKNMNTVQNAMAVKNCTSLPKEAVKQIVDDIVTYLLRQATQEEKYFKHESGKVWNIGSQSQSMIDLIKELGPEKLKILKQQSKGFQTLLRNHSHLISIKQGNVVFRVPTETEYTTAMQTKPDRLKLKNCYWELNHPNGCPMVAEKCRFRHITDVETVSSKLSSIELR